MIREHTTESEHLPIGNADSRTTQDPDLVRWLDGWCRQHGYPSRTNSAVAATAIRRSRGVPGWRPAAIRSGAAPIAADLGDDPRRWPPAARYLLADLERSGLDRVAASRAVRAQAEHPDSGSSRPAASNPSSAACGESAPS